MNSAKVLSIFQHAKVFLNDQEMVELVQCIEKQFGKAAPPVKKSRKIDLGPEFTHEAIIRRLLAGPFRPKYNRRLLPPAD